MWHEIFVAVYFCGLPIFFVLMKLIFAIRTDFFSCWELSFASFRKYPLCSIDNVFLVRAIEIHIFKQYYCVRTLCKTSKFIVYRLVSERKRQVVTE